MAKRSYSHKTAMAAVKRGHGGGKTKAVGNATGNTASYPSSNSGPPYNNLSATTPAPSAVGRSARGR